MSYYLPEKKALFLHVPRTGGTWIKEAMYRGGIPMDKWGRVGEPYRPKKHTLIPHIRPELWGRVGLVFAFVRHPVDYYISVWRFTTRSWKNRPDEMHRLTKGNKQVIAISEAILRWKPDFSEWLDEMIEEEPGWATRWFERFVGPPKGEFCYFIGRTETLEQDTEDVLTKLGYGDLWNTRREQIKEIRHARNKIRSIKAPPIEVTEEQRKRIERSERVLLRRFYGEDTFQKRVYRNFDTGEPT